MKISTRLRLNALIALAAAVLFFIPLFWSYGGMSRADRNHHLVLEIRRIALERQVLRDEYFLGGEERARLQWLVKSERFRSLLQQARERLKSPREKELLDDIGRNFASTVVIFSRIAESRAEDMRGERTSPPGEERRITQIKLKAYLLSDDIARLEGEVEKSAVVERDRMFFLLALFIVMGVVVTVGNSALLNRMLSRRLGELRAGAEIIGSGNLEHRLASDGHDELADLARLTNRMAANLQGSFTSVKYLEMEIGARKEAEEALRKSEERYYSLIVATSQMIWTTNAAGEVVEDIPLWRAFTGQSEEEVKGWGWSGALHPEDLRQTTEIWSRSVAMAIPYDTEYRLRRQDGEYRTFFVRGVPVFEEDGTIREWVGACTDITERKRIVDELIRRKMELDESQRVAQIGSWDWDLGTDTITWSDEYYRIYAIDPALPTPNYRDHLLVYTAESAARLDVAVGRALENGETYELELELAHPDAERRWILAIGEVKRDADGRITGLRGTAQNITERKSVEDSLLKLSSAIEQSPVSIVITDSGGDIEFVNPKFTQLTGYAPEEAMGQNPRILKSGKTPPETYRQLWSAITSGRVWHGEFHNRKKNGEIFLESATISPVKNRQGTITHYIAIKEDVTERRSLEIQLRQAQKMEAIGTLSGGIAHDFNNILTAIIGFASLLEMKMSTDNPLLHNVTQILAAADRAAGLTRSLLAFSRKQQIETRVMSLSDIVAGLEKMLRRLIREDIELTITPATESLPVLVDVGQIEQVLINLVTNARDALPGGGRLTLTTGGTIMDEEFKLAHGYGEPGEYALLVVADNGVGMAEDVRQRVFDPFFTTKEVGKGTGLGLSVCYGIVKQHGGYINCSSEPGRGTTFRIYLPLVRREVEQVVPAAAVPLAGGTETILLAEDDPTVRELTTNILREFGYSVIEARDGEDAVAKFRADSAGIGLCLFDVIMPKLKGWEAFEAIREIRPDARGLFMSGYQADAGRLKELIDKGAGIIAKPVVPRDLLRKVREQLDG